MEEVFEDFATCYFGGDRDKILQDSIYEFEELIENLRLIY